MLKTPYLLKYEKTLLKGVFPKTMPAADAVFIQYYLVKIAKNNKT
jgi:hypothetical protein